MILELKKHFMQRWFRPLGCGRQQPGEVWIQTKNLTIHYFINPSHKHSLYPYLKKENNTNSTFSIYCSNLYLTEKAPNIVLPDELKYILGPIPCPKGNREGKTCLMWLISNSCRKQRKHHLSWLIHILQQYPDLKTWWQVDTYLCP